MTARPRIIGGQTSYFDPRAWRSNLRLASALTMLAFVISHLTAHAVLLVSFARAEAALDILMYPWQTLLGTALLLTAFFVHYANALWSIYVRRSLRLSAWEWAQLALGLTIPAVLMAHVIGTRVAASLLEVNGSYTTVLITQWLRFPWLGVVQAVAVLTVWTHAGIGIHFWLRTKPWYPTWRILLLAAGLLLPTLALAGFVAAGNEVLGAAENPDYVKQAFAHSNLTEAKRSAIVQIVYAGLGIHAAMVALPFAARGVRRRFRRRQRPAILTHASGRSVPIVPGATVLETLREHAIPHASVCGGRARCTTCRILVTKGFDQLSVPSGLEAKALARIVATAGIRLACQIRPSADISIVPLLTADASAADGAVRGGLEGNERPVTVVFVDLRGSTGLGEAKMPYDVLFVLNQFFHEMTKALEATNGHYSQFTGDGLMALYGLEAAAQAAGPLDAIRGAREMLGRLDQLNQRLRQDLAQPMRIGIGIHYGEAIVGAMGPPRSQIITAIGDTVNTCARLESLTKDYDCAVIVSRRAAEAAGLGMSDRKLHEAAVKGRAEPVQFYALKARADLPI